jgi:hypothetical protein
MPILLTRIHSCDRASQLFTGSDPLFVLPENLLEPPPMSSLPSGFRSVLQTPGINAQIIGFVAEAKVTALIKTFSGYEGTTDAELRESDTFCRSVAQYVDQISSHHRMTGPERGMNEIILVEESLCYGLSACRMMMLRSIPPDSLTCTDIATRLKDVLVQTDILIHWREHLELLLWIAFMGAHTVSQGPLRVWYIILLNGINDHLGTKSWEEIKKILKSFLWIGRCEVLGTALWIEVESKHNGGRVM